MSVDSLLDSGARGLGEGLVGAAMAIVAMLAVAICLPVLVVALVVSTIVGISAAAPAVVPPGGVASASPLAPAAAPPAGSVSTGRPIVHGLGNGSAIDVARRYLGVRYVFGGTDPSSGLDCSGLVQLVFRQLGVALPRTAQLQYDATAHLTRDQLQPGDLVFFARTYADPNDWVTHVGIYIGDGQQINAPTEGQVVSIQPVFTGFWGAHFIGGGRVVSR
jgi:hypothetical protein